MNKRILAQNAHVVMGVDVHQSKHIVSYRVGNEGIVLHGHVSPRKQAWTNLLKRFPGCCLEIVYEAGAHGFNLYDWLKALDDPQGGIRVSPVVAPPGKVPKSPADRKVKTDRRDSRLLIQAWVAQSFEPVVAPSAQQREERELVRTRNQLMNDIKDTKNRIIGLLKFHGIAEPEGRRWSAPWRKSLRPAFAGRTQWLRTAFAAKMKQLKDMEDLLVRVEKHLKKLARKGACAPMVRALAAIRGVGELSATIIATEVADFKAFRNSDAFASYTGLVPGESSSGDTVRRTPITRQGNRWLRWILVELAWCCVRYDPEVRAVFYRIRAGRSERTNLAIVAVARRLAVRIWHTAVHGAEAQAAAAA